MDLLYHKIEVATGIQAFFEEVFTASEGEQEGLRIGHLVDNLINQTPPDDYDLFVAQWANTLVGAIFISRMSCKEESELFILAPVAVAAAYQGQGIGKKLIQYGIKQLRERGAKLLVTYGDPAFYAPLGFQQISEAIIQPPFQLSQPEGWLAFSLDGSPIRKLEGKCTCVRALQDEQYW